jgi:Helix-turn-helix domain
MDHPAAQNRDSVFARKLTELMNGLSVRELAKRADVSSSSVQRYKSGEVVPTLDVASALDGALAANGELFAVVYQPDRSSMQVEHRVSFPTAYGGDVWIVVIPVEFPAVVKLVWGPWELQTVLSQPTALVTGKNSSSHDAVLVLQCAGGCSTTTGLGTPPSAFPTQQLHTRWKITGGTATTLQAVKLIRSLLENHQRSLDEFAEFLGLPTDALLHNLRTLADSADDERVEAGSNLIT